jgi:Arc/MetJ family transcription regulator
MGALTRRTAMRTTVTLDDDLLAKAIKMTGGLDRSTVLREGLKALIERESAMRLAKLGGTQPQLEPVPRRRAAAAP